MNEDGKLDIVAAATDPLHFAVAEILLGNGDGTFGSAQSFSAERAYGIGLGLGDFNGDKHLDVVVSGWGVVVLPGTGSGGLGSGTTVHASSIGYDLATGDLDGDGNLDIAALDANSATVLFGNGTGAFPPRLWRPQDWTETQASTLRLLIPDRTTSRFC
jgi:hypothetical protein